MNSIKIEKGAVEAIKKTIRLHDKMDELLQENDKGPSWDGDIYLYNNIDLKAEHIQYRIPTQIKGKNNNQLLHRKSITYPVEYKNLRNYFNDGGVCYFVIVVSDDGEKASIFYNALTPIKLQAILKGNEQKQPDQTKNIALSKLKNNDKNILYEPRWSGKLSIEYRKKFGYVPDKKTREAVRELAGFLMGRDLKLIGRTEYSKSGFAIRAMAQNPQSVNIVKVCRLCNQEIVPVHIYGNESLNFKETMEQLLPRYLHSDMRDVIQKTLPLYWSSFVLYVDNAIPVIASAIETLQKAWFALEENESVSVYYPKTKFRELKKDLIAIIDEKLEEGPYKNAVRNKVDQLNQMSVRDKNESFFAQLGITYGEREIQAIRMRNVFAHGDTNGKTDAGNMIEAIKVLQLLYAKSVLKLLGYEGEYIDWCDGGTRKTVY